MRCNMLTRQSVCCKSSHNRAETNTDASTRVQNCWLYGMVHEIWGTGDWQYPPRSTMYHARAVPNVLGIISDRNYVWCSDNRLGAIKTHMNLVNVADQTYP